MTITSYSTLAVRWLELLFFRMMESLASPPIRGPVPSMTISTLTSLPVGAGYKVGLEPKRLALSTAMRSSTEPDRHDQTVKRIMSCCFFGVLPPNPLFQSVLLTWEFNSHYQYKWLFPMFYNFQFPTLMKINHCFIIVKVAVTKVVFFLAYW